MEDATGKTQLERIVELFARHGVEYIVIGGMAEMTPSRSMTSVRSRPCQPASSGTPLREEARRSRDANVRALR